jgi:hypothetical protein
LNALRQISETVAVLGGADTKESADSTASVSVLSAWGCSTDNVLGGSRRGWPSWWKMEMAGGICPALIAFDRGRIFSRQFPCWQFGCLKAAWYPAFPGVSPAMFRGAPLPRYERRPCSRSPRNKGRWFGDRISSLFRTTVFDGPVASRRVAELRRRPEPATPALLSRGCP